MNASIRLEAAPAALSAFERDVLALAKATLWNPLAPREAWASRLAVAVVQRRRALTWNGRTA